MISRTTSNDLSLTLAAFNAMPEEHSVECLLRCCGSTRWAERMTAARPFKTMENILSDALRHWHELEDQDWLEAFGHHPRIGDITSLREKYASTAHWATEEQRGAASASDEILKRLAIGNLNYEKKFAHIFLVCATGKSAAEMVQILESRMIHDHKTEMKVAATEQAKITRLRLEKLFTDET